MSSSEDEREVGEEGVQDLSNSDVVTKYRVAADIANTALKGVVQQCVAGKSIADVCAFGDAVVEQRCATVYKSKKIEKGVAFPTCVSVNECVCHYSPLKNESKTLKAGDWVKVDIGCHIDGYIAVAAHTFVVPSENESEGAAEGGLITGEAADVLMAAYHAAEVATKLIRPGNKNTQVTEAIERVAECYKVNSMAGTLMHQMKRFVIDGAKVIVQKQDVEQKVEECEFELNEVYCVDVCFSTGEGKARESEDRTTVFKRLVENNYRLKMKASRYVLTEINNRFPTLPFTIRALEDEKLARMGVVECVNHDLVQPYPVLYERDGDLVAHLKFTVLILPSGTTKITGLPLDLDKIKSDKQVDEETAKILASSSKTKKKKKKAKKAEASA